MLITPLQALLRSKVVTPDRIRQVTGASRSTVWRWKEGRAYPRREQAEQLIALYGQDDEGRQRLDFNGCYDKTLHHDD